MGARGGGSAEGAGRGRDGTRGRGRETGDVRRRGGGMRVLAHLSSISNVMADASPRGCRVELLLQRLSAAFQSGDSRAARPVEMHARPILPSAPPRVLVRHPGVRRVRVVAAGVRARVPRRRAAASPVFSTLMFQVRSATRRFFRGERWKNAGPRSVDGLKFPIVERFFFSLRPVSRRARRDASREERARSRFEHL